MSGERVIQPWPPEDGREWDSQCARCGSSCGRTNCDSCGGQGHFEEDDPESLGCGLPEVFECDVCEGAGGWMECLSSADWCENHAMDGCHIYERGKIEWFPIPAKARGDGA